MYPYLCVLENLIANLARRFKDQSLRVLIWLVDYEQPLVNKPIGVFNLIYRLARGNP